MNAPSTAAGCLERCQESMEANDYRAMLEWLAAYEVARTLEAQPYCGADDDADAMHSWALRNR